VPIRLSGVAVSAAALGLILSMTLMSDANAQPPAPTPAPQAPASVPANVPPTDLRVLDIEKRRIVTSAPDPARYEPSCDVLVVGGGAGGVAAAEAAAKRGANVVLIEPTRALGGQFTTQLVPVPDENRFVEQANGPSTAAYRELRERVRAHYVSVPSLTKKENAKNIGACWVSRVSGTPDVWEVAINERTWKLASAGKVRVYKRHQLRNFDFDRNGRVRSADLVNLDNGQVLRVEAKFVLDATEDGDGLYRAGLPTVLGQEAKSEFNEPHAPEQAHPEWVQSFTYCFLLRWIGNKPPVMVEKPAEYDYFKSLGEYTLDYVYSDARGVVPYKVLTTAKNAGGPFWTYRRLMASQSFGTKSPEGDVALINWRGNDFHEESYIGKPLEEQVRILNRGYAFAMGFLYWLQNECPRDDGKGAGYPEMQPAPAYFIPTIDPNGFALHPYIRESRRLKAKFILNENHLLAPPTDPEAKWGEAFPDSVGTALYAVDIHPAKGEPPLLTPALPYHLPLGAFLTTGGAVNVLPAAKNFGATRLALASARMHPTEWLAGEVAGTLAAFCLQRGIADPAQVRDTPDLLAAFQSDLRAAGVTLYWSEILPPATEEKK
jgi:hypothetical protein